MQPLSENTIDLIDKLYAFIDDIKSGETKQIEITGILTSIASADFRNEHEKKIDHYCEVFLNGAMVYEPVPEIERTALNSPRTRSVPDLEYHLKAFKTEHFKYVQQPFWEEYKKLYKNMNVYKSISPTEIYEKLKEMKNAE